MSIKRRIILFQLLIGGAILLMAGLAYLAISVTTASLGRVQWSRQQLDVTRQAAVLANRYSEQIAETLLIGAAELPDLEDARADMAAILHEARDIAQREILSLDDPVEREQERLGLERLDLMESTFGQIDRAVDELLVLRNEGRHAEAIALFRSRIENRLDADFERLIAAAVADERGEVERVDAEAARLARALTVGTLAALGLMIATIVLLGLQLYARIARPLRILTAGTQAIERGELGHRVSYDRDDELGRLARRFNRMAEQLERERSLLDSARQDLERQVTERTCELADANLRLRQIDRQRVRFLADASHELRTPLTVLRGEAEVALRGARPEGEYRETLERIVQQSADLTRIVEDLLFVARSEGDDIGFELQPIHLAEIVDEALAEAAVLARPSGTRFLAGTLARDMIVMADARRLKQALLVVLDNAIKYATSVEPVELRLVREAADAVLVVRDAGPGIPPDELSFVVNRFFRGENARVRGVGGSGLGLPIARHIVEKHGGQLRVDSEPGQGTSVTFRLPARE